jgi:hypothetical protein
MKPPLSDVSQVARNFAADYLFARGLVNELDRRSIEDAKWDMTPHVQEVATFERDHLATVAPQPVDVEARAERECTACKAGVAEFPEVMCCHCREVPWKLRPPLTTPPVKQSTSDLEGRARELLAAEFDAPWMVKAIRNATDECVPIIGLAPALRAIVTALLQGQQS